MVVKIPQRPRSAVEWQPPRLDETSKAAAINLIRFYGSSIPRPRVFSKPDGSARVDPPVPVTDPLLSWANEAHWSMGGLSFNRLRLQGRIEGSVEKLRVQQEKKSPKGKNGKKRSSSVSPPPAPMAVKRRRYLALSEDEDEEEDAEEELKKVMEDEEEAEMDDTPVKAVKKKKKSLRKAVRKLGIDFERVASEEAMKKRTSPRLTKLSPN